MSLGSLAHTFGLNGLSADVALWMLSVDAHGKVVSSDTAAAKISVEITL